MISTNGISLAFGQQVLFKDISIKFVPGNCYGLIGANGAGKSTFLKILSGDVEADHGDVFIPPGLRIGVLKQNQFEFDESEVLRTVLMGNKPLYQILIEKDAIYDKGDMTEEDGIRASELESQFAELGGWDAESQAAEMLGALGVETHLHGLKMKDLESGMKVRVLLAQALFGNPDILLLDEPTNNLDIQSIMWLEEFLCEFKNTVIVVSHDRHFLDKVSTHMADIDFGSITVYTGNYTFWYQASQLALQQRRDQNRKAEDKIKDLKAFIERFSANASKSRQATSRKKMLSKLSVEEIKPSTRRYPHIVFQQEREAGKDLLQINALAASLDGETLFKGFDLNIQKGEKVAFVGPSSLANHTLFQILMMDEPPTQGTFRWGVTTSRAYLPKDNNMYFREPMTLLEWLRQTARTDDERSEEFLRGFLGKMLFSGEEAYKKTNVLSGGEKVRCMLARIMMAKPNVLVFNEPTNHLDLESITALNNALIDYKGTVLFASHDREFVNTVASRIIELSPNGHLDKMMSYDEYLESPAITAERQALWKR